MNNPWEIKTDDSRNEDTIPTFIIFCEDKVAEPSYFKYFETDKIKINCIGEKSSKLFNVFNAIDYCDEREYFDIINSIRVLKTNAPIIWCVYDKDIEVSEKQIKYDNNAFDTAIETAQNRGFKVAWSNDAFELWILLHFEDVNPELENFKHRTAYYDKLTEILKAVPEPNEILSLQLKHPQFNYKDGVKSQKKFTNIVLPLIQPKIKTAISRAKALEKYFSTKNGLHHKKVPCTLVHHLVEELIEMGGKEI